MGIPSYYKKLCDRIPGLLSATRKGTRPTHLWIDFNCMVYHCLKRPGAKPYEGEETRHAWEAKLIQDTYTYLKKVVSLVGPTEQVYIGVDGVVPMAKMRQQRLRRFKSHWVYNEERRIGKSGDGPRWDTNAITPGTEFMDRLCGTLKTLRSEGLQWVVSGVDEPGEGEHKAMQAIRSCKSKKSHVIYGLDADLILLSLLQPVEELWLFREAMEAGSVAYTGLNEEKYSYFSIHLLRNTICSENSASDYLLDYCMAMSFLGNDFLPHGLTLKLKDGGHDMLLSMLRDVRKKAGPLINQTTTAWNLDALKECVAWIAEREESLVVKHCTDKLKKRHQVARGATPLEVAVDEWNKLPLRLCDELALIRSTKRADTGLICTLADSWKSIYNERYLRIADGSSAKNICKEYIVGLDWILKYYTGSSVDKEWCFPWFLPPLMSDLHKWLELQNEIPRSLGPNAFQVKPQEQLALVLPLESWWLLRDRVLRELPLYMPQLWPSKFQLFTAGHSQTWECEAQIPLFMPERLRWYITRDVPS